ncbi:MAG: molybdopterin molybdotransferase MoeA [Ignavibacteria bacterium]|nr:molybdopterin molybdotransferase MoeA [Ignavibacteria bacterium]
MISTQEAKTILREYSQPLPSKRVPLLHAGGRILAETIVALIDVPPFDQSSVDGYALNYKDLTEYTTLLLSQEIPAGKASETALKPGETARIFTGSPMPNGADTVIMQEFTEVIGNTVRCNDLNLKLGGNVRPQGSQTKCGENALAAGSILTPAAIGLIAGLGITEVSIIPSPKIALITTGNELVVPGDQLLHGQVFESNSYSLRAALAEMRIDSIATYSVRDEELLLTETIRAAFEDCEVLILTGGVSVGDYDYVPKALENCGVEKIIHKIRQRPGKPFYFGVLGSKLVFGLPGNPSSVLTCFYRYVKPMLLQLMNIHPSEPHTVTLPIAKDYIKKEGLTFFLKGCIVDGEAMPLGAQESYQMNSYARAECLIELEESRKEYQKGDRVTAYLL